jgi:DNA-binding transcriptional regulator GbsR (MarR family)
MSKANRRNINTQINKVLQIGTEWLGLQRTSSHVLGILYKKGLYSTAGLSIKSLVQESGLSQSTVSSICSNLESLDIIVKRTNGGQLGRGRKSAQYSMAIGIDELLRRGLNKCLERVDRVSKNIDQILTNISLHDNVTLALIAKAADEINQFLSSPSTTE